MSAHEGGHPVRCWLFDGHERCAVRAAAQHAENRAAWLRANDRNPTSEAVATALAQLNSTPRAAPTTRLRPGRRVLTVEQIREVRDLYGVNGGEVGLVTMRQLASHFNVSHDTIFNIIHTKEEANAA